MFTVVNSWREMYPGASVGVLLMADVLNPRHHPELERRKRELEKELQVRYGGQDREGLRSLPTMQAYHAYYKRFKKSYHVQLQLESVALKGKSIPGGAALVEAMFMAELRNMLLTAGHDWQVVEPPVTITVASGCERFFRLDGREQVLKAGDMMIADAQGVISSVLYGPDQRTQIRPETRQVLFTVYAPAGIGEQAVDQHLREIQSHVLTIAAAARTELLVVYGAG